MQELTDTLNNGETEVLVVPKGEFYGSDSKGNPIPESIDEQVIDNLEAQLQGKELLVDKDHSSVKEGNDRDTSAMGWMHSFKKGVEGLWAKIRWTNIGKNLVENRVFRFLSPVFTLKGDKPTNMLNVALTNQPAFQEKAKPIINNQPTMETITMELTKEELIDLIKQIILDLKKEKKVEELDKAIDAENDLHEEVIDNLEQEKIDVENGVIQNSKPEEDPEKKDDTEKAEEVVDATNVCDDTEKVESTNTDPEKKADEADDMKEDKKEDEEEKKEEKTDSTTSELDKTEDPEETEEEEEEVIKIEALNATPKTYGLDVVKNTGIGQRKLEYPEQGYAIVTKVN